MLGTARHIGCSEPCPRTCRMRPVFLTLLCDARHTRRRIPSHKRYLGKRTLRTCRHTGWDNPANTRSTGLRLHNTCRVAAGRICMPSTFQIRRRREGRIAPPVRSRRNKFLSILGRRALRTMAQVRVTSCHHNRARSRVRRTIGAATLCASTGSISSGLAAHRRNRTVSYVCWQNVVSSRHRPTLGSHQAPESRPPRARGVAGSPH